MNQLVDAATAADKLGVSRDYVYRHARELGVVRLGTGEKARLRFDLERVLAAVSADRPTQVHPTPPTAPARPNRRTNTTSGFPLLPIKGGHSHVG